MKRTRDAERLGAEDAALVERLREEFRPEALDAARRAAFDARLRERRLQRRRRPWAWTALATATAAALAWAALPGDPGRVAPQDGGAETVSAWEQEVVFGEELGDPLAVEDGHLLPPDYVALASAFDL